MTDKATAATETKPAPKEQSRRGDIDPKEPVPVQHLTFVEPTEIPGCDHMSGAKWSREPEGRRRGIEIHYLPWMRHHRIIYFDAEKGPLEYYVPEANVRAWMRR